MTDSLPARLTAAYAAAEMVGWDFSRLDGRMTATDPAWNFEQICLEALTSAGSALDMGTGGGERLLELRTALGPRAPRLTGTEGWAPNVEIARTALATHGIDLVQYDSETDQRMPLPDGSFDVVMARHEAYDAQEVLRVLRPGGRFLTQQVEGQDVAELYDWFGGEPAYPDVNLGQALSDVRRAGFVVDSYEEWSGPMQFCDTRALVEYLGLTPWVLPDFTVAAHVDTLQALEAAGPITLTQRRYRITATKPA